MSIILNVHARQIFDSRGNPTVEVDVITDTGTMGRAAGGSYQLSVAWLGHPHPFWI